MGVKKIKNNMEINLVTGNKNKYEEIKSILKPIIVKRENMDLVEIQELNPKKIIEAKLKEGLKQSKKDGLVVEDVSLNLEALKGLPGPLIKWFLKDIKKEGIYRLTQRLGNNKATAKCLVGYAKRGEIYFFEGTVKGTIVKPRGNSDFGFDPIFLPEGGTKTFAEMTKTEKNRISHRTKAFQKLKRFIKNGK